MGHSMAARSLFSISGTFPKKSTAARVDRSIGAVA